MHRMEEQYYKINRIFLKMLGLWPYQQTYFVRMQKVLLIGILVTFILAQLLVFITTNYNANLLLKILSFVFPVIFVTIKYCIFVIKADNVKRMLDQIRDDWSLLKDKLEIDIIKRYACNTRLFTVSAIAFCYSGLTLGLIFQCLPIILDIISPLNESRPCRLVVITEYFVDQEEYFYALLMHEVLAVFIGAITLCCTGSTILMYILHACALLKIASYRIENAIGKSLLAISSPRREYVFFCNIVQAVIIHQRATGFIEFLTTSFVIPYIILTIIGVSSLSLNLFQFLQSVILTNNTVEAFSSAIIIFTQFIYMFGGNYGGQEIIDHGIEFFTATYNGLWYAAPLQTQKLLLFVMQRGMKNVSLTFSGIFVASLEGFASMTSTAISYFTVIYSTRL